MFPLYKMERFLPFFNLTWDDLCATISKIRAVLSNNILKTQALLQMLSCCRLMAAGCCISADNSSLTSKSNAKR